MKLNNFNATKNRDPALPFSASSFSPSTCLPTKWFDYRSWFTHKSALYLIVLDLCYKRIHCNYQRAKLQAEVAFPAMWDAILSAILKHENQQCADFPSYLWLHI